MERKYALPSLIEEVAEIIDKPEDIFEIEQYIPDLTKYVENNYIIVEHEPEEVIITACYDYLLNEIRKGEGIFKGRYVFSMDLLDAIQTIVEKESISTHTQNINTLAYLKLLEDYKLIKYNDNHSKAYPNLACKNIYNIYLYHKDITGIGDYQKKTSRVDNTHLSVMLRCRTFYSFPLDNKHIGAALLRLQSIKMIEPVKLAEFSDEMTFYIMTPLAQSYLRTTRKIAKYDISAFVYPVIDKSR